MLAVDLYSTIHTLFQYTAESKNMFDYKNLIETQAELTKLLEQQYELEKQLSALHAQPKLTVENVSFSTSSGGKFTVKVLDPRKRNAKNNWNGENIYFPSFSIGRFGHRKAQYLAELTRDYFLVALGHTSDIHGMQIHDQEVITKNIEAFCQSKPMTDHAPDQVVEKLKTLFENIESNIK